MFAVLVRAVRWTVVVILLLLFAGFPAAAQSQSILRGKITDPLGQSVPNAKVLVLQDNKEVAHISSNVFCGKHTKWGELVGRASLESIRGALRAANPSDVGLHPEHTPACD
jgi:hypothetical protein